MAKIKNIKPDGFENEDKNKEYVQSIIGFEPDVYFIVGFNLKKNLVNWKIFGPPLIVLGLINWFNTKMSNLIFANNNESVSIAKDRGRNDLHNLN